MNLADRIRQARVHRVYDVHPCTVCRANVFDGPRHMIDGKPHCSDCYYKAFSDAIESTGGIGHPRVR